MEQARLDAGVGTHWRSLAALSDEAAQTAWHDFLCGTANPNLGFPEDQEHVLVNPLTWSRWDPERLLMPGTSR